MRRLALAAALIALGAPASACRLALAMALDVSGSVDQREYRMQLDGLAEALGAADVRGALLGVPDAPVALAVYEWSSSSYQNVILNWTELQTDADIDAVRERLRRWQRLAAPEATGLGAAMLFGNDLMARAPECWDQTLDVSGDGKNNDWPLPERLKDSGRLAGLRINGLVVATDLTASRWSDTGVAELSAYFKARIIQGPGAFIEVALGYEDYARAMRRKLLRELTTLPVGALPYGPIRPVGFRDQ